MSQRRVRAGYYLLLGAKLHSLVLGLRSLNNWLLQDDCSEEAGQQQMD